MSNPATSLPAARALALWALVLAIGCAPAPKAPGSGGGAPLRAQLPADVPLRLLAEPAGGYATAVDEQGTPTFIWSSERRLPPPASSDVDAARFHAARFAPALGLGAQALAAATPVWTADRGDGGLLVHLGQRVGDVPVYRQQLRLLMRRDHSLVALSGSLHPLTAPLPAPTFTRTPQAVLARAISHATARTVDESTVTDLGEQQGDDRFFAVSSSADVTVPERTLVRRVLFPTAERLRPAWVAEFYAGAPATVDSAAWRYVIADDDGSVLERTSLTQYDAWNYRVWIEGADKRPADGPMEDYTPHPRGYPDWSVPQYLHPQLVTIDGFNRSKDPWLLPTAVDTEGNNATAYIDRTPPDGYTPGSDFFASTTSPGNFDRAYDLLSPPTLSKAQAMAGIVQAFYVANWLHDYWYDSGFDENAANAQKNNYGRGGAGGDPMHLETQDFSGRDNSNMSTFDDGISPRMQIYLWSGSESRTLHIDQLNSDLPANTAVFGPDSFDISGDVVEVNDNTSPSTSDGCEPIANDVADKIALLDRGNCTFKRKAVNAEAAGAIGIILVNNTLGDTPKMGNGDPMATTVGIGILSTSKPAGASVRAALAAGPVSAHLARVRDIDREGALDNSVLFHEWGHYLHHRNADCGATQQCGALSEGWADFTSLHTVAREGDNLDGAYALAIYASAQFDDPAYFGIRRQPYSVNFDHNGLTFRHISDGAVLPLQQVHNGGGPNSEVHNAGEVWATMMWEAYVALQKAGPTRAPPRTFEQVRRIMSEYVVTGLRMTAVDATYLEQRDAIIAAAGAADLDDQKVIADAFARRGAGTCADAPPRSSQSLQGVVEGFTVQPRLVVGEVTLDESGQDCDKDGVLDAGERGHIVINLSNGALAKLTGATVTVSTTTPGISLLGKTTFPVPDLDPYGTTTVETDVAVDSRLVDAGTFSLVIQPSKEAACGDAVRTVNWRFNYDIGPKTTRIEDFGVDTAVWTPDGDGAADVWQRLPADEGGYLMHARDTGDYSDTSFESPDLVVSKTDFFIMRFTHRHSFKAFDNNGMRLYLDGAVVEISTDGGANWEDISKYAQPGYDNTLTQIGAGNPLEGQKCFVDKNPSFPKRDEVVMNLLDKFAGKTVRVRFRMSTIQFTPDLGWDISHVIFKGIDNTPFTGIVPDWNSCAAHPVDSGCTVAPRGRDKAGAAAILFVGAAALLFLRRRRSGARA